jgi:hypothetical protein
MADEDGKKQRELYFSQLVAQEMNKTRGTDYEAGPSDGEPADATLRSKSGKFPTLPVQVVSIPLDFRHRDDKHSVDKIRESLKSSLQEHGFKHYVVGLILSGKGEMRGIKHRDLEILTDIVLREAASGGRTIDYGEIYEQSSELSELVHTIIVSHHEELQSPDVDIPAGGALPPDGRWIKEGIKLKVKKYGGAEAVKELVLVICVAGFVDDDQVDAFLHENPAEGLPFLQIWIVTPFHGVICLKP